MNTVTIEGEAYRIIMNDNKILSAVRPEGEQHVIVLLMNKSTHEVERRKRKAVWLNQKLKEEAK